MAALFLNNLAAYEIINPTQDYLGAERSGRCNIVCLDAGGVTISCAMVDGWTGAKKETVWQHEPTIYLPS